jgi:hypothetical protein
VRARALRELVPQLHGADALERRPPLGLLGALPCCGQARIGADWTSRRARSSPSPRLFGFTRFRSDSETNTLDRLAAAEARGAIGVEEAVICGSLRGHPRLRLGHQLEQLDAGLTQDNWIDPARLGKSDRLLLKEAFKTVGWLQRMLEDRFQTNLVS